jgi:hypothetical protein
MRVTLLTALIGAATLVAGTHPTMAQSPYTYPYCLEIIGGPISCYYANLQQCRAATFDHGGTCVSNPFRRPAGYRDEAPLRRHHHRR